MIIVKGFRPDAVQKPVLGEGTVAWGRSVWDHIPAASVVAARVEMAQLMVT